MAAAGADQDRLRCRRLRGACAPSGSAAVGERRGSAWFSAVCRRRDSGVRVGVNMPTVASVRLNEGAVSRRKYQSSYVHCTVYDVSGLSILTPPPPGGRAPQIRKDVSQSVKHLSQGRRILASTGPQACDRLHSSDGGPRERRRPRRQQGRPAPTSGRRGQARVRLPLHVLGAPLPQCERVAPPAILNRIHLAVHGAEMSR